MKEQMLCPSLSIPSTIAEGSKRKGVPDIRRFFDIQKASILSRFIDKTVNCEPKTVNSYFEEETQP